MVAHLCFEHKIIAYNNIYYRDKTMPAVVPSEYKDEFINLNIIQQADIYSDYDFQPIIEEWYKEYWQKDKNS